ncbi:MAG TPA: acyl-CoA dehydrogenase family protein [Nocardioidaceae bacterium]|nr:acyl-CoA dehydrogenase family protein [Nocardioidaceae bacterium]
MSTPFSSSYTSPWKDESVLALAETAEKFVATEVAAFREKWEEQHFVDREVWLKAGQLGLLCCSIPEEYGGGGGSFAHDLAVFEALAHHGDASWGVGVHSGIVAHYILAYGTEEQKQRWLPKMATGEWIAAVAMTEPGAGSDLKEIRTRAVKQGAEYVINGNKIFISNGRMADLIVTVVKTDPAAGAKGISLLVVEADKTPGFVRGRILEKVGQHGADTSELFYEDAHVPVENLLGGVEGQGFGQLMTQLAQERLILGVSSATSIERAIALTTEYAKTRDMFGQRLWDFQNTKFVLAECATTAHVQRVFVDNCIQRHLDGFLDINTAAMLKWWASENYVSIVDRCVQIFGGYGYMREYPIARMYEDARVSKVYAGSNETMKELIARSL